MPEADIAKSSTVIRLTPKSEYVTVISTVADGLRLACWCSFSTHGKMSLRVGSLNDVLYALNVNLAEKYKYTVA